MLKTIFTGLSAAERTCLLLVLLLVAGGMVKSWHYTRFYGGSDLRACIVAARVLASGGSPYFYKWAPGEPERLLDPNDRPDRLFNGVTVAPGILYVQRPFAGLQYPLARVAWTLFQYLLLAYIFASVLLMRQTHPKARFYALAVGGLFFLCSPILFLNIERGQVYILYSFFLCILYQLYQRNARWASVSAGAILAVAVLCRPTLLAVVLPFLVVLDRWVLIGAAAAAVPLGLHAWLHMDVWKDYATVMRVYTGLQQAPEAALPDHAKHYPAVIEGATNLSLFKTDFIVGGLKSLQFYLGYFLQQVPRSVYLGLYGVVAATFLLLFRKRLLTKDPAILVLAGFALYLFTEYTMPAPRAAYALIEWTFPVLLMLQKNRLSRLQVVVLAGGLCLMVGFPFYLPGLPAAGELLLLYCLLAFIQKNPRAALAG